MPSSAAQAILVVSQQYTIYVSFIILFGGLIGNILNIIIFAYFKLFRRNQSGFYLIFESIINCFQLLVSFSARIAINGFADDLTQTSLAWCKLRYMIGEALALTSLTTVCFAAIDQFLSTHCDIRLRQMSTLKLAHYLTFINVLIWLLHSIPFGIFFEIQPSSGCTIYNIGFSRYYSYVYLSVLLGFLPVVVSSSFSLLAYRNVRHIIQQQVPIFRRRLDQQLTAMVLIRSGFLAVVTLPYIIQFAYKSAVLTNPNDSVQKAKDQLLSAITISFFYINYAGSFYLFIITSARFRRQVEYVLVKIVWRKYLCKRTPNPNQVAPIPHVSSIEMD